MLFRFGERNLAHETVSIMLLLWVWRFLNACVCCGYLEIVLRIASNNLMLCLGVSVF